MQAYIHTLPILFGIGLIVFGVWGLWKVRRIETTVCGHRWTRVNGKVTAFGETIKTRVPIKDGATEYCHFCLGKMAIRCAWCGHPIFIGDRVTLYVVAADKQLSADAADYIHKGSQVRSFVGCMRPGCSEPGSGDAQGVWVPPGRVQRIPNPIELSMQDLDNGVDGIVIVKNR